VLTPNQSEAPVDLVEHEDGVLDDWIASLAPDEFEHLLKRLATLRDGFDALSALGW
jgi:hypothetical protein